MTELLFKTKFGAQPQGKPRVYFTCHPADFERSFEKLCGDLFAAADCAVYYTADMADRLPEDTREFDLDHMNLFVIPVSFRLLTEPNRAMDEDFPFALEKRIPVLPILLETGLDVLYSRENRFGALQYLDPITRDDSAVPYAEKLKKYLDGLLSDETAASIRDAFDAYVFLSYRKKDRKQANELIRLIHNDPACRNLAVWFDEYLTPGESFTDNILSAMKKSELFALLVTPNLLESNAEGGPNYVQNTEFPAARDAGMELLPAEFSADGASQTDRDALARAFPGLPDPLRVASEAGRERFLARLRALRKPGSPENREHLYYLGLAYLYGIDVETDRARGVELITASANAPYAPAILKLFLMYRDGDGVPLDYRKAKEYGEALLELCRLNAAFNDKSALDLLASMQSIIADVFKALGESEKEFELCETVYMYRRESLGEEHPETLRSQVSLASAYAELGELQKALELLEQVYPVLCRVNGEEHPTTLSALGSLAMTCWKLRDNERARTYAEKAYALSCKTHGKEHPHTLTALHNLAVICWDSNDRSEALSLMEQAYSLRRKILGEEHPDTKNSRELLDKIREQLELLREGARRLQAIDRKYAKKTPELEALEARRAATARKQRLAAALDSLEKLVAAAQAGDKKAAKALSEAAEALRAEADEQRAKGDRKAEAHSLEIAWYIRVKLPESRREDILDVLSAYARAARYTGESAQAADRLESALDPILRGANRADRNIHVAEALEALTDACMALNQPKRCLPHAEIAWLLRRLLHGELDEAALNALRVYVDCARASEDREKAAESSETYYRLLCKKRGETHSETIEALRVCAEAAQKAHVWDKSKDFHETLYRQLCRTKGETAPETVDALDALAWSIMLPIRMRNPFAKNDARVGNVTDFSLYENLHAALCREKGETHPETIRALLLQARARAKFSSDDKATAALFKQVYELRRTSLGETHPDTLEALEELAERTRWIGGISASLKAASLERKLKALKKQ